MTQVKHTPGPWVAEDYAGAGSVPWYVVPHDHKGTIAALTGLDAEANARLIAAAPDMLEALQALVSANNSTDGMAMRKAWGKADAAIARATGEKP